MCISSKLAAQQIRFIENKGQWENQVLYKAEIPGGSLYITSAGLVYNLIDEKALHELQHNKAATENINAHAIFVDFLQAQSTVTSMPENGFSTLYNYYLGNNPDKWAEGVKAFQKITLRNVYPKTDFVIEGMDGWVKTSFVLRHGANPANIQLKYRGANQLKIENQDLVTIHSLGQFKEDAPETFIKNGNFKQNINSYFVLRGDTLSYGLSVFKGISRYDSLIIDPSLVFSTFSGSVADNFGFTSTFDLNGNGYGGGTVYASGFPTTPGAYQISFAGGTSGGSAGSGGARDCGILKFSANGSQLLYATYLGGSNNEQPHSMSCDANGNLYILGTTASSNFPYINGYDATYNGSTDIFIASLSANGNQLRSSTFFGGSSSDGLNTHNVNNSQQKLQYNYGDEFRGDIRIDPITGNICIASTTTSSSIPLVNPIQSALNGSQDGLVLILTPDLKTILFSTYFGGSSYDAAYGLRIDKNILYVTGGTLSSDLPRKSTNGTFLHHGGVDGFLAKFEISSTGNITNPINLYIGSSGYDQTYFVSTDKHNRVFLTGQTTGVFAKVGNVYYESGGKQFITVIDSSLSQIVLQSTYGSGSTYPKLSPSAFMVDQCDRVYISGWGGSANQSHNSNTSLVNGLITTSDAFQKTTDGSDFHLIIFNKNLASVGYATYIGGPNSSEHVDGGTSHFDEAGIVYQSVCAGCGGYSDFPTTPNAYSKTNNGKRPNNPRAGGCNNAVFKFSARPTPYPPVMQDTTLIITASDSLVYLFNATDANSDLIRVTSIGGRIAGFAPPYTPSLTTLSSSAGLLQMQLAWRSGCEHANDTLVLWIGLSDNACEAEQTSVGKITIIVKPAPTPAVNISCVKRNGLSSILFDWENLQPENQKYIKAINVYRSKNNGTYITDTAIITSATNGKFLDQNLENLDVNNYCYRIRTVNVCSVLGDLSRETCSMSFDTIVRPSKYKFSRDSVLYVNAVDVLDAAIHIADTAFGDSVFVYSAGSAHTTENFEITHQNGFGNASIQFHFQTSCDMVGDTFYVKFWVMDNRCPIPMRDSGIVYIVVLPAPPAFSTNLNCVKFKGGNDVAISWKTPANTNNLRYLSLLKYAKNTFSTIDTFSINYTADVLQTVADLTTDTTCFAMVAYNQCNIPTDTGEFACVPWAESAYPESIVPHYVTVVNNKQIEISWSKNKTNQARISRFIPTNKTRTVVAELSLAANDTIWTDKNVQVQEKQYCYVIEPISDCGLLPKFSPYACSILLHGKSEPFTHYLDWTPYEHFEYGTNKHELSKQDLTETSFSLINTSYSNKHNTFTDEKLNHETGVFYYQVQATENFPNSYTALSNTVELVQAPLLHVPNAFTPNGDGTNDTWNIVPVFVKEYHLKVYDRWGKLVFETTDKHKQMSDKDFNNEILALDAFVYVATYTGFEGTVKQVTGNVTILK